MVVESRTEEGRRKKGTKLNERLRDGEGGRSDRVEGRRQGRRDDEG